MTTADKIAKAFAPKSDTRKVRLLAALEALKRGVDQIIRELK